MKFSVCVEQVFRDCDIYESLERLGEAGIRDIEFTYWMNKDIGRLTALREKYRFHYLGICPQPGGSMADPVRKTEFLGYLEDVVRAAKELECKSITLQSGDMAKEISTGAQYHNMMEILQKALKMIEETDIVVLLEPRNYYVAPRTFLGTSDLGYEMIRQMDSPKLKLLYDIYHMQLNEGNVLNRIRDHLPLVGHIHAAGIDGRNELCYGELNYDYIFQALDRAGYDGYIGLEYFPSERDPLEGLKRVIFKHRYV